MKSAPEPKKFLMPAEWETHAATWMAWPYDTITFPGRIEKVEKIFSLIIYYLHHNELVNLLILNKEMQHRATKILKSNKVDLKKIIFHIIDYADVWIRDYGPTFLTTPSSRGLTAGSSKLAYVKWKYNAYGEKFPDLLKDDKVISQLKINYPKFEPKIIMEGGAIDVNGNGLLITTEECLLNPNRNKNLTKKHTEKYLMQYLGVNKIIWLKRYHK